jgi:4-amino-4-deoxy-L-arabinose transferase-like glycosyltransferase
MKKIALVIILIIISSLLVFYRFVDIPKYLAFDEVEFTKLALSLNGKPYAPYSTLATGHSTLYFYILLMSLKLFGITTFALRLPAAIFGILSVLLFYLIMKKVFQQLNNETPLRPSGFEGQAMKQYFPFLLSFILLSSHWFLNFSRFSFEATFLLFLELTSIYFFIKYEETQKAKTPLRQSPGAPLSGVRRSKKTVSSFFLVLTGTFAGLAFLSYTPGRIFFLLPLFFILFNKNGQVKDLSLQKTIKQCNNETIKRLLLFLIPFLVIITPLTSYLINNKDTRIDQQFFLMNHEMPINQKISGLWNNISSTALMFNFKGDMNGRHNYPGKPALNPILGLLFIIGLIITMKSVFTKASTDKQWNNNNNKLFLFYFILSIFPALMTYPWENPNMLRTYTVLPSVVYFIGIAILFISNFLNKIIKIKLPKYLILNTIYLILIFSSFYELRTYFKYQSKVFTEAFDIRESLQKAIKIK